MKLPACTPCGLGVDWSRRCYSSEWHLFAAPDDNVTTPGRYYFSPSFTPFVAGYHIYGSRDWYDKNWRLGQGLGESLTARQSFDKGDVPATFPQRIMVGEIGCLERGEDYRHRLPYNQIYDGFSTACLLPEQLLEDTWPLVSTIDSCSLQFFYATIIGWLYQRNWTAIETAFHMLVPGCSVFHQVGNEFFPSLICVVTDQWSVLVSDGTVTYQQWALQAFYGISAPEEFGLFGTLRLWYDASSRAVDFMNRCGANPFGKFMISGHSYGGANASLIAARIIAAGPLREVALMTFGCPKPGDLRLRVLLHEVRGIHLSNRQDVVCSVPPTLEILWPIVEFTGLFEVEVWSAWEGVTGRALMDADGSIVMNLEPILDSNTLLTMLGQIIDREPINDIVTHSINVYRARILRRCPDREWPIDLALFNFLKRYNPTAEVNLEIGAVSILPAKNGLLVSSWLYSDGGVYVGDKSPFEDAAQSDLIVGSESTDTHAELIVGAEAEELAIADVVVGDIANPPYGGLVIGMLAELAAADVVVGVKAEELAAADVVVGDLVELPAADVVVGESPPLIPGTSCADALELPLGTTFSYTTNDHDVQWYKVPFATGTTVHIRVDAAGPSWQPSNVWVGTSCGTATIRGTFFGAGSGCFDFTEGVDSYMYFAVALTVTPCDYTFTWDSGPC